MNGLPALGRAPRPPSIRPTGSVVAEAVGVAVRLGGTAVLDEVDLAVRAGEVLALVGPNGAGKSTLLAALAGDQRLAAGTVRLHGRPVSAWTALELAMRRAVLLQETVVSFPFTVREIVEMGRAPWAGVEESGGEEFGDDDAIVAAALDAADVTELAARTFPTLSGGERARAALARVLAQQTGILLLDEPTAALDLRHQELVMSLVSDRASRGHAVVLVVHDLNLAAAYADRVAMLAHGRLVAAGVPADVLTGALLSEVYEHPIDVVRHPYTGQPLVLPASGRLTR